MEDRPEPETRLRATVHGRVQGVSFRYYAIREALNRFQAFLHRGSPSAFVQQVDEVWEEPTGEFEHFRVRHL